MARQREAVRPLKRKGFWYLVRRVPRAYEDVDDRGIVYVGTGILVADDPRGHRARHVVEKLDDDLARLWKGKKAGRGTEAEARYARARETAQKMGFAYITAGEAAERLPTEEILRRLEALRGTGKAESTDLVEAVLGGIEKPRLMVSAMVDEFERVMAASITKKSEKQRRKWRVEREGALALFLETLGGDRPLAGLTRSDALNLRALLEKRIVEGKIEIETANKYMGRVSGMYRMINDNRQLDLGAIFANIRIAGGEKKQRVAFAPEVVRDKFLADGMFEDLNDEARGIIYLVAETGLRLSEACNLSDKTIKTGDKIPHVLVRPEGREMKTDQSRRDIPLVGAALEVMKKFPGGFPRYRDKADSLSALVNKALDARGLRTEEGQSLYSLRHTFEDRLTAVEAPEKIVASLMGHKWYRPRYGKGPSLEQKRAWLLKIAFKAPPRI